MRNDKSIPPAFTKKLLGIDAVEGMLRVTERENLHGAAFKQKVLKANRQNFPTPPPPSTDNAFLPTS